MAMDPITAGLDFGKTLIERWFPNKDEQDKRKADLMTLYANGDLQMMLKRFDVIIAEAQSSNRLTSSWRPITMLTFVAIIANNYILAPYLHAMGFDSVPMLELPPDMWDLLRLGIGGYVIGRSVEKGVETYVSAKKP